MREIKFRAWDKENKKMIYKSNVRTEGVCLEITLEGKIYDEAYGRHDSDGILNDKYVLMQYTGLKDKNGVEIYELDVLLFSNGYKQCDNKGVVTFKNGYFVSTSTLGYQRIEPYQDSGTTFFYKVIGNIHENQELL